MDAGYEGGQILSQLEKSPAEIPDYILFDGGTNDAEYLFNNKEISYGEVTDSKDPQTFDLKTFAGAFENLVYQMRRNGRVQILYMWQFIRWAAETKKYRKNFVNWNLRSVRSMALPWQIFMKILSLTQMM